MTLRVAPCPRCNSAIVFGERGCRACGQPFDYGAAPPPVPTPQEIKDALVAVGAWVEPAIAPLPAQTSQDADATSEQPVVATLEGIERTRMSDVGEVAAEAPMGFERTQFAPDALVEADAPVPGLFHSDFLRAPPEVPVPPPPEGLFHSDFLRAPGEVPLERIEIETHTGPPRPRGSEMSGKVVDGDHPRVVCRCGEPHKFARCPSCGTART